MIVSDPMEYMFAEAGQLRSPYWDNGNSEKAALIHSAATGIIEFIAGSIDDFWSSLDSTDQATTSCSVKNPAAEKKVINIEVNKQSTRQDLELEVISMPKEKWQELSKVVAVWKEEASRKWENLGSPKYENGIQGDNGWMFEESALICQSIAFDLQWGPDDDDDDLPWDEVQVCQDNRGKIHAVALWNSPDNTVTFLATNPDNIRHKVNESVPSRAQGAGTEIILHLAEKALATNKPIRLKAVPGAISFYEKLSFEMAPEDAVGIVDPNVKPMKLTPEKISQCAKQKIIPYDRLRATCIEAS